ncbi:MAG TPA: tetratricopeptide repeat protein [Tepidisphaeraceae bacterium]|jgi:tetratricopeptide (TPR) repeat protein|nr:tetratricopeptide repeat protein [Tepidisphaeraceae bacterium]
MSLPLQARRFPAFIGPLFLLFLTIVAYAPVIFHAGYIWDDPDYVIHNPLLRNFQGLLTIWTSPSSLPQYYPLVHTTYWIEYHLVGLSPHLYHLDNVLLHGVSAILFYFLLRQLKVPGALFAGALFAAHPLMVESVAWITERKNTLSMVFYLASAIAYLRFESDERRWRWYAASLLLLVCALLSKTVTSTLPAALVLLLWWQGRRLNWRTISPLIPFFLIAVPLALFTAHLEKTHVGATGVEFDFSVADRLLIASRAVCFYAGKLLYPYPLCFIYPRWNLDPHSWMQWLPLALCLVFTAILALFSLRNPKSITRNVLIAWLLFVGTLTPALGFFNVYPMRYSFVADHFAYHAMLAPLALIAAGVVRLFSQRRKIVALVLIPGLCILTFTRCFAYQSGMTLWVDTVQKNPDSWMPHVNLGHEWVVAGNLDAAEFEYRRAAELAPNQPEALINVGGILAKRGRYAEAAEEYQKALAINPEYPLALFGMGSMFLAKNDAREALPWLERAVAKNPDYAQAQYTLGRAYEQLGDPEHARLAYEAAVAADPEDVESLYNLGTLYLHYHQAADAAECFRRALSLRPGHAQSHANLAAAYLQLGQNQAARSEYQIAARLDPALAPAIEEFLATQHP